MKAEAIWQGGSGSERAQHFLFVYGSLLSVESRRATVGEDLRFWPATISDYRRTFTHWDAEGFTSSEADVAGFPFCALNVEPTQGQSVNGIVLAVPTPSLRKLATREQGYSLVKVRPQLESGIVCPRPCFMFVSTATSGSFEEGSPAQVRYLRLCLAGARELGPAFLDEFLRTTYVGDHPLADLPHSLTDGSTGPRACAA